MGTLYLSIQLASCAFYYVCPSKYFLTTSIAYPFSVILTLRTAKQPFRLTNAVARTLPVGRIEVIFTSAVGGYRSISSLIDLLAAPVQTH